MSGGDTSAERAALVEAPDDLAAQLIDRYGASRVIKRKKRAASVAADDAVYEELAQQCDLVITGSGD